MVAERARVRVELVQLNDANRRNQDLSREIAAMTEQRHSERERQRTELLRKEAALNAAHRQREALEAERREMQERAESRDKERDTDKEEWRATDLALVEARGREAEAEAEAAALR
jgi:hypothetical protein